MRRWAILTGVFLKRNLTCTQPVLSHLTIAIANNNQKVKEGGFRVQPKGSIASSISSPTLLTTLLRKLMQRSLKTIPEKKRDSL